MSKRSQVVCMVASGIVGAVLVVGCQSRQAFLVRDVQPALEPTAESEGWVSTGGTVNCVPASAGPLPAESYQPSLPSGGIRLGVPVLGDVPHLGRLFGTGSRARGTSGAQRPDEVLVVEKREGGTSELEDTAHMTAKIGDEEKEVPLPLKHTDVKAQISAFVATVDVTQQYHNPFAEKIEAVYVFPLPENAAVTDFIMVIGERRIRGIIREREEAQRIYQEARRQGYRASLLTQERPNIFTQRVANIEPGHDIDVQLTYFHTLHQVGSEYEFVFPTVVGPRFNPPGSTDGVGAVAHGADGTSGQSTEVTYLKPGTFSSHDLSLTVDIEAGMPIHDVRSPTHVFAASELSPTQTRLVLAPNDRIPNRDIVIRYRLAENEPKGTVLTHADGEENTFALLIEPPKSEKKLPRAPREMVFVVDCSGSMNGWPLAKAKEAMVRCLKSLGKDDTFQIIRFSSNASKLGADPVPATAENVRRGVRYLKHLKGGGGTMMIEGIKAALDFAHDPRRVRIVSFMTDGFIGNESEILGAIQERLGSSRIFSFGVGSSVNRYLLTSMARFGQGEAEIITLDESPSRAVDRFYAKAARPALRDVRIHWGGMDVRDVYPRRIPHLYVGKPVVVVGRYRGRLPERIEVSGMLGDRRVSFAVAAGGGREQNHPGIAGVWARRKLQALADEEIVMGSNELRSDMIKTSVESSVLCGYTAFVAVDSTERTAGDHGTTVKVPVPVPHGVRYETTVQGR
ncbi:MAG: VWA domain-containing protein [Lentisphaerae bacterium]|nr:VWA domain-containing protein [Lentisphaerota bacterium]